MDKLRPSGYSRQARAGCIAVASFVSLVKSSSATRKTDPRNEIAKGVATQTSASLRSTVMDTDHNLLFGMIALQAELIDATQFIEACLLWTTRKNKCLADLLLGRGWIEPADRDHVEYLLERRAQKHGGDAHASLAAIPDDIKRSLAALDDDISAAASGGNTRG